MAGARDLATCPAGPRSVAARAPTAPSAELRTGSGPAPSQREEHFVQARQVQGELIRPIPRHRAFGSELADHPEFGARWLLAADPGPPGCVADCGSFWPLWVPSDRGQRLDRPGHAYRPTPPDVVPGRRDIHA